MSMTKTHFEDKQSQFSRLVDQIVVAIRSDDSNAGVLKCIIRLSTMSWLIIYLNTIRI